MLSTVIWLFFSQLSKRDSVRLTIAVVVLLQHKYSPLLTNVSLESSFLTSIFRQNLSLPIFKFCCFFVVLFFSNFFALNMEQFEE